MTRPPAQATPGARPATPALSLTADDVRTDDADAELARVVSQAADGSERAWTELIRLYGRRVFGLVRARCRNAEVAKEITQTVFAKVAVELRAGRYDETGKFEAWLFRIAVNKARDEIRKQKRRARLGLVGGDAVDSVADGGTSDAPDREDMDMLRTAIDRLGEADREIVHLRHHGQMSFQQIAELLDAPVGTLLARHHRALKKLRGIIEQLAEGSS
ncbi:MAG: sigma-70 family RNA polymerase sigma factor [Planctomycetota bacterium]